MDKKILKGIMESHRIHGKNNYDLSEQSKSNMAEFSPNPDDRKKKETSYKKYNQRQQDKQSQEMQFRVSINKKRDKLNYQTLFNKQEEFDEILEESELENEKLINFLIHYDLNMSIEENKKSLLLEDKEKVETEKFYIQNGMSYVSLKILAKAVHGNSNHLLNLLESVDEAIKKKNPFLEALLALHKIENIIQRTTRKKTDYFISYCLVLHFANTYKSIEPKSKLNGILLLLILDFKNIKLDSRVYGSLIYQIEKTYLNKCKK